MVAVGERVEQPELEQLKEQGKKIYSISKLNSMDECEYEAGLTYKKHQHGSDGVYGIMGTKIHDSLEIIMNSGAEESSLLKALNEELDELDMLGIEFPKDRGGGDSIRKRWVSDVTHFCNSFVKPMGNFTTEEFFLADIGNDRYLQGYIDLIQHFDDDSIAILDWKTSTQFSQQDLVHHGRQLVGYVMAKEQQGFKVRYAGWIMIKYATVTFAGYPRKNAKAKTEITKVVQRSKLVQELRLHLLNSLIDSGISELEANMLLDIAESKNDMTILPRDVQMQYTVNPYIRKYGVTDSLKAEFLEYCNRIAERFETMSDNEKDWGHRSFYTISKFGKRHEDTFRCSVLCNHRKTCRPLQEYFEMKDAAPVAGDEWELF